MKSIQFSNLTLECATRTLRNQNGNTIVLRPLPYEVLMLLLQKNEPVSREELFETCWEGLVVTDQALTNVVSGLRRNLLSLKAQNAEIKTISKVGYFIQAESIEVLLQPVSQIAEPASEAIRNIENERVKHPLRVQKKASTFLLATVYVISALTALLTLLCVKPLFVKPNYIKKDNYKHLVVGQTNFYLHDATHGFISASDLNQILNELAQSQCNADVYIRLFPSIYEPNMVALTIWFQKPNGNKNHVYRYFNVQREHLRQYIADSYVNMEAVCEF
ncbi:winged helix-turn-helix domain-containing protein [Vibrio harveyi]|nr:winged helix-turn-helix domain-containing protein [Vibrio harveyi]